MYLQDRASGPPANQAAQTLPWWVGEGQTSPGENGESLARRILGAPNLGRMGADPNSWVFGWSVSHFIRVGEGNEEAKLRVLELPPGDYHVEFHSKVNRNTNANGQVGFSLWSEAERRFRPSTSVLEQGTIFLLHPYNGEKELMSPWGYVLAQAGYRVILVDLRGHGESTGQTFSYGKLETADLEQALNYLTKHGTRDEKVGVLGFGYGANLALQWAARDSRVGAVVAMAPFNRLSTYFERMAGQGNPSISSETLRQALGLVATRLDLQWDDWSAEAAVRQLKEPVLFVAGGKDAVSTTNEVRQLEQMAHAGSKSIFIGEASHEDVGFWLVDLAEPVKSWFQEHLVEDRP
jgi:pimeloyl-ACP methyl ester carboxylesterase